MNHGALFSRWLPHNLVSPRWTTVNGTSMHSFNHTWDLGVVFEYSFYPLLPHIPSTSNSCSFTLQNIGQVHPFFHCHHCHLVQATITSHLVPCSSLLPVLPASFMSSPSTHSLHSSQNWNQTRSFSYSKLLKHSYRKLNEIQALYHHLWSASFSKLRQCFQYHNRF